MNYDKFISILEENDKVEVYFVKANNEKRLMQCTLKRNEIPKDVHFGEQSEPLINVYDLEKKAIRTFNVDRVMLVSILKDNEKHVQYISKRYPSIGSALSL